MASQPHKSRFQEMLDWDKFPPNNFGRRLRLIATMAITLLCASCEANGYILSNKSTLYNQQSKKMVVLGNLGMTLRQPFRSDKSPAFSEALVSTLNGCGTQTKYISELPLDFNYVISEQIHSFGPDAILEIVWQREWRQNGTVSQATYLAQFLDPTRRVAVWKAEITLLPRDPGGSNSALYLADLIVTRMSRDGLISPSCQVPNTPVLPAWSGNSPPQ